MPETGPILIKVGRYRWLICGLLLAAMIINYVDRQMLGILKPTLGKEMGWTDSQFADVIFWFQGCYALSYLAWGGVVDRIGARIGFGAAFLIWQVAHLATGAARGLAGFTLARMALGVGEAGAFPGALKVVAEWFPRRERALATGIFNAGTNIGAILTPLAVPALVLSVGWRPAFVVVGAAGLIWLPVWLLIYRRPREQKRLSAAELAYIEQDPADPVQRVPWRTLIGKRETWAYALGKFLVDPVWSMFLYWLPDFFGKRHGLDLKSFGPPLVAIYLLSDFGSVGGGWLSSRLLRRGWSLNAARKTTLLTCALLAVPVSLAAFADNLWLAVLILGVGTAAHQGFSANLYTLASDVFPRAAVGSVVGIGGMLGAIGSMTMTKYAGWVLDNVHSYAPIFIVASTTYLLALGVIHLLTPKMAPVEL